MGAAFFYKLTRNPVETTLPILLEKASAAGWRVLIRGTERERLEKLNELLWLKPAEGFLPHGMSGTKYDSYQPVLLTIDSPPVNEARCLMCINEADVTARETNDMERVCILFDGNSPAELNHARNQWKTLVAAGCEAQYWSEEKGKWHMVKKS
ncbi:MAG: DNA polymerase III subunit chi [Roseovarius sp.]|nr:DNA polymerase III subunit chi [Roseovarius sp.]MCY4208176.1 DNA polymerase III subunit chi [Roseovarius sp.]MCY4290658.1 DNA polymerase III subunit chi [Roseovarius sp.]MCY4316635.1 DNA polymerase III subunit chi [Roseovarius sp.]